MKEELKSTPITDDTFIRQKWERVDVPINTDDEDSEAYYFWQLPLPKDNPDKNAPMLISSCNDQWEELYMNEGEYSVEIYNLAGLGYCDSEEEIEIVYNIITREDIYAKPSPKI